jgi:hypothetical protein
MSSATSILALFDLYRRTFGDRHVVLSLAYSLYTATSIFLLEIKALKYAAAATVEKVKFCVFALERVKGANNGMCFYKRVFKMGLIHTVITTGLGLIYQELQKLQVDIPIPIPLNMDRPSPNTQSTTDSPQSNPIPSRHVSPTISTPKSVQMPPSNTSTSTPPILNYHHFQNQLPVYDPASQIAFVPDLAAPQHHTGPMPPGIVLNQDGSSMRYELHSDIYEAFSFVEPMNPSMAPAPYDPTTWTMNTGTGGTQ